MINKDRIVPIQAVDRLTSIGEIMAIVGDPATPKAADDIEGNFTIGDSDNKYLLNQPAKTINVTVTDMDIFFIPGFTWEGFKINGAAVEATGAEVKADCTTLYRAALSDGAITVTQITPAVPA